MSAFGCRGMIFFVGLSETKLFTSNFSPFSLFQIVFLFLFGIPPPPLPPSFYSEFLFKKLIPSFLPSGLVCYLAPTLRLQSTDIPIWQAGMGSQRVLAGVPCRPALGTYFCCDSTLSKSPPKWDLSSGASRVLRCLPVSWKGPLFLTHLLSEKAKTLSVQPLLPPRK